MMYLKNLTKRGFAVFLAVVMIVGFLPIASMAEEGSAAETSVEEITNVPESEVETSDTNETQSEPADMEPVYAVPAEEPADNGGLVEMEAEASVNGVFYKTLQEAVNKAGDGDTVTLCKDVAVPENGLMVARGMILDLNGYTLSSAGFAIWVQLMNGEMTIQNGTVTGQTGIALYAGKLTLEHVILQAETGVACWGGEELIIAAGTVITSGDYGVFVEATKRETPRIVVSGSVTAAVSVGTGEFNDGEVTIELHDPVELKSTDENGAAIRQNRGFLNVTGGVIDGKVDVAELVEANVTGGQFTDQDSASKLLDGDLVMDENGNVVHAGNLENVVARVDSETFETLQVAVDAADGKTVTLLKSVQENVVVPENSTMTLDLNGKTLNGGTVAGKAALTNYGTVTILDSSEGAAGTICREDDNTKGYYTLVNAGKMYIKGGTITNRAVSSSLVINLNNQGNGVYGRNEGIEMEISGGTLIQEQFVALKSDPNTKLIIKDGATVISGNTATNFYGEIVMEGGNVMMPGNVLILSHKQGEEEFNGSFTVTGGTLTCGEIKVWNGWSGGITEGGPSFMVSGTADVTAEAILMQTKASKEEAPVDVFDGNGAYVEVSGGSLKTADGEIWTVAETGGVRYLTVEAAVAAAADSGTVKLLKAVELTRSIEVGKDLTLDLNGQTVTVFAQAQFAVNSGAKLTVTGNGTVNGTVAQLFLVRDGGSLLIENGMYKSASKHIVACYGTAEIEDGTFVCTEYVQGASILLVQGENAVLTVKGGSFEALTDGNNLDEGKQYDGMYGIDIKKGAKLVLGVESTRTGPNIRTVYAPIAMNNQTAPGKLTIYGGSYTSTCALKNDAKGWEKFNTALYLSADADVTIYGGTFRAERGEHATEGSQTYAISVPYAKTAVNLTIHGGTFHATDLAIYEPGYNSADGTGTPDIKVDGGIFCSDVEDYCVDGYVTDGQSASGMFVVVPLSEVNSVASVTIHGETEFFMDVASAMAAANEADTAIVSLYQDISESITVTGNVTLMLNGRTLSNTAGKDTITVALGGVLTVTGEGTVDNTSHGCAAVLNNGTANLNGGVFDRSAEQGVSAEDHGGNSFYTILNHGNMVMTDATIQQNGSYSSLVENGYQSFDGSNARRSHVEGVNAEAPSLRIVRSRLVGGLNNVKNDDNGSLTVAYGVFTGAAQDAVLNWNTAVINSGSFDMPVVNGVGVVSDVNALDLTVLGGIFVNDVTEYCESRKAAALENGIYQIVDVAVELRESAAVKTGETLNLSAVIVPENAVGVWASSDETVAGVDQNGTVTGRSAGTAMITVTVRDVTVSCAVTVEAVPVPPVPVGPSGPTMDIAEPDVPLASVLPFDDVAESDWFYDAVKYVYENGLMQGTSDNAFEPYTETTRGMIVTILYRMEGSPTISDTSEFRDVTTGAWYHDAVVWGTSNGIVSGYGDGTYGSGDIITREQFAAILYRYAQYKGYDISVAEDAALTFADSDAVSDYAKPALLWAVERELIHGMDNNTLSARTGATRAQAAIILDAFCENIVK